MGKDEGKSPYQLLLLCTFPGDQELLLMQQHLALEKSEQKGRGGRRRKGRGEEEKGWGEEERGGESLYILRVCFLSP